MLVFRGADVFPGDGPCFRTDVGVADGKIVAIARRSNWKGCNRTQEVAGSSRLAPLLG